ncbi:hypothetical protein FDP41_002329 [Naegleria fowleri]|uniref:SAM domain-containing protein n=1 Tax=Naegleria fowleri TaxID=5763 RepID=A0A6A5BZS7_NAEFO|nr:uncharacterized protein FDP41_002329 [Naegleria fowleri]KAF0978509.1 hypothetical protein FDP41_002329 [Naegleria fowleri]CAG4714989.1 unnamed protein product [Naegleria fowleri]
MIFLRRFSKTKTESARNKENSSNNGKNNSFLRTKNNSFDHIATNKVSLQLLHSFHHEVNDDCCDHSSTPSTIREKIQQYYSIESLIELQDPEALDILRDYLRQRKNEEYLSFLEMRRDFRERQNNIMIRNRQSCSRDRSIDFDDEFDSFIVIDTNNVLSSSPSSSSSSLKPNDWLLFDEMNAIFNKFLNWDSEHCMNVPSQIREQIQKVMNDIHRLNNTRRPRLSITSSASNSSSKSFTSPASPSSVISRTFRASVGDFSDHESSMEWQSPLQYPYASVDMKDLRDRIQNCLNTLTTVVMLQFNNEIMPHFKKTEEFKTFIIAKLIELSSQEGGCGVNTRIEDILNQNELSEYVKTFSKMKLIRMEQIKDFTSNDLREKIGVKKVGHLKRIERLISEYNARPILK